MISWTKQKYVGGNRYYREGNCKSTDTKPTSTISDGSYLGNGSVLFEMDTTKAYMYDQSASAWVELGA